MVKPTSPRYRATNWNEYNAALKSRGSLRILAGHGDALAWHLEWQAGPQGEVQRRRHPVLRDDQVPVQSGVAASHGDGAKSAEAGLDWQVPDFSTMNRPQKRLSATIKARPTTTGSHLLVDSTDSKMLGEGEWKTKKHGADYRRRWRKVQGALWN